MKNTYCRTLALLITAFASQPASADVSFVNFIRQTQFGPELPSEGVAYDHIVDPSGQDRSPLAIDPGGARFELWTVGADGISAPINYLLASTSVATFMPVASIEVFTVDTTSEIARTRVDHPFQVKIHTEGLLEPAEGISEASQSVNYYHFARSQKDEEDQEVFSTSLKGNGDFYSPPSETTDTHSVFNGYPVHYHSLNSADPTKAYGVEWFRVESLPDEDYGLKEPQQLDEKPVIILPMADGSLSGITDNQELRFRMPMLTLVLNDLYPGSTTYVRAYKGECTDNPSNPRVVPGSFFPAPNFDQPTSTQINVTNYDSIIDSDGKWTLELVTDTPFGRAEYLDHVTFTINRKLDVRASVNTIE